MTPHLTAPPAVVVGGLALLLAISPLLAGWTAALAAGERDRWWRWRATSRARKLTVAAVALTLGVAAAGADPYPAWWLYAAGGGVLAVVDAQAHLLPARLVYPLGATIAAALTATAAAAGEWDRLLRAALAAVVMLAVWLAIALAAPSAFGLGDVRLFTLTAGLLGWTSWTAVLYAQAAAFLLAGVSAALAAIAAPGRAPHRRSRVAMGPPIIVAAMASASIL